jgi:hypothetical protein
LQKSFRQSRQNSLKAVADQNYLGKVRFRPIWPGPKIIKLFFVRNLQMFVIS